MNPMPALRKLRFLLPSVLVVFAISHPTSLAAQDTCPAKLPVKSFRLDSSGNMMPTAASVVQVGYSQPAPVCVTVLFDALRFNLTVTDKRTTAAGQSPGNVLTTGVLPTPSGGKTSDLVLKLKAPIVSQQAAVKAVTTAITDLQNMVGAVEVSVGQGGPAKSVLQVATTQFTSIAPDLKTYQANKQFLLPSDLVSGTCTAALATPVTDSLLDKLNKAVTQAQSDLTTHTAAKAALESHTAQSKTDQSKLKGDQAKLTADTQDTKVTAAVKKENLAKDQQAIDQDNAAIAADEKLIAEDTKTLDPDNAGLTPGAVIDSDNASIATLQGYVSQAGLYKCGSAGLQSLTASTNAIDMWITRLGGFGFGLGAAGAQVTATEEVFQKTFTVSCKFLFNNSASDELDSSYADELPTLSGGPATAGSSAQAFYTFTCAAPVVLTGGIEISGIPDREYQIVKAAGANNTVVNQFGYATNSAVHILPIAAVNIRIWEPEKVDRKLAFYGTVGVSGNLQGQQSGGSSAEYLLGPSMSILRTLFITAGAHIGYESVLTGGFKVGDPVPTDIVTPQVSKSATVRWGIGITFKP